MLDKLLSGILGSKNDREVNRIRPIVTRINEIEEALAAEPEQKLRDLTRQWQAHLARYHALDAPPKPQLETLETTPLFPRLRSGHRLFQRPSRQKQIPSSTIV